MKFCPECGGPLEQRQAYGRARPVCPACGYVGFRDPKVAVAVIVARDGAILLTLRAHDPGRGLWGLPAGYMEWDERVEDAALRETLEETGLDVRLDCLVGVYSYPERGGLVLVVYAATPTGGTLRTSEESTAVEYWPADALPPLAFPENTAIIADWRAARSTQP
jgi:ADP-ribose pyrophosphatase YjhB (NUDIX family)